MLQVPPRVLCTMKLTPKMDSPPAASTAGPGFAPAALPYKNRLWRRKVLKIQIRNRHLLDRWGVKLNKFMECANRWSNGAVSKGSNHIPRFETDDEDPDIVVELNGKHENISMYCVHGLNFDNGTFYHKLKRMETITLPLAVLKVRGQLRCTLTSGIQTRNTKST